MELKVSTDHEVSNCKLRLKLFNCYDIVSYQDEER
jgi:hypothetical protein